MGGPWSLAKAGLGFGSAHYFLHKGCLKTLVLFLLISLSPACLFHSISLTINFLFNSLDKDSAAVPGVAKSWTRLGDENNNV